MSQVLLSTFSAPREHKYISPIVATPIKNKLKLIERTCRVFDKGSSYMSPPLASLIQFRLPSVCAHLHSWIATVTVMAVRKAVSHHCFGKWDKASTSGKRSLPGQRKNSWKNHEVNFRYIVFLDAFSLGSWNMSELTITHNLSKEHKDTGGNWTLFNKSQGNKEPRD